MRRFGSISKTHIANVVIGFRRTGNRPLIDFGLASIATFAKLWMVSFMLPVVLTIVQSGCGHEETARKALRPVLSVIATAQSGPTDGYSGLVEPRFRTDLGFRVLGKIVARDVNVGDSVKAGDRLAAMDPELLQFAIRSTEAVLANSQAQLVNSESNLKRQTTLLARKITPQAEFDAAQQANEAAASAVTQAQANLVKAREQLFYTELFADIDGVVMSIAAEAGQTVAAGQTVISIASPAFREAVVDLGEDVVSTLAVGAEFRVTLQISPNIEAIGSVREMAPQADATTRTRRVRITLIDPPDAFRLGATITAYSKIALQERIRLPRSAVLKKGEANFVWIVDELNAKVKLAPVNIFQMDDDGVQIEDGIQVGVRVVTAGVNSLTDGQSIRSNPGDLP